MTDYVLELYLPRVDIAQFSDAVSRVRSAAAAITEEGSPVHHLHSLFVPEDETCFHIFSAESADGIRLVADRADIPVQRITQAVANPRAE